MDTPTHEAQSPGARVIPIRTLGADEVPDVRPRWRIIMRLLLRDIPVWEIAEAMNMHPGAISRVINSDIFKAEFEKLQSRADAKVLSEQDAQQWIKRLCTTKVTKTLEELLDNSKSERLKADICFDLLDRGGHSRTERREVVVDYASAVVAAFERRKALRANGGVLPGREEPVRFADIPDYTPPSGEPESKTWELEGFDPAVPNEAATAIQVVKETPSKEESPTEPNG